MLALVRIALSRPLTFIVMAVLIVLIGPLAALRTPTDILPDINIPVIAVVWQYQGLPASDMAGRIIYYYERTMTSTVNNIEHIESQSMTGVGVVKVYFQPGTDIRTATAQVTSISQTVLKQMPPGITPPQILNYSASTVPILQLAFSSPTLGEQKIYDTAQNFIRPALATVPGAATPSPYGGKVRQIQIDLDSQALQSKGLSAQDVENAVSAQNLIIPAGTAKIGNFEYDVQLNDSPDAFDELNNLPIKTVNGATLYVRDVAHVRDGSPPQTNVVRVNGGRSVLMTVLKSGASSTLSIVAGVKAILPRLKETLPPSFKVLLLGDQSIFVKAAVSGVIREGVIAAALTSLMILLFLGSWRSSLIIAVSIPLAVLCSITALSALGQTLNVMKDKPRQRGLDAAHRGIERHLIQRLPTRVRGGRDAAHKRDQHAARHAKVQHGRKGDGEAQRHAAGVFLGFVAHQDDLLAARERAQNDEYRKFPECRFRPRHKFHAKSRTGGKSGAVYYKQVDLRFARQATHDGSFQTLCSAPASFRINPARRIPPAKFWATQRTSSEYGLDMV